MHRHTNPARQTQRLTETHTDSQPERQTGRQLLPVNAGVRCLHAVVHLQDGLVVGVGRPVALHGVVGRGPPQEGLEGKGLQLQGSVGWD